MPLKGYGVWRGTPTAWDPRQTPDHGHLTFTDASGGKFDSAVNVKSQSTDTRLVYWLLRDFDRAHPITARLAALPSRFRTLHGPDSGALDFLRGGLVDVQAGVILAHDGSNNDIIDYLDPILQNAVHARADMFLFGQQYFPEKDGIHDIHMNQGSVDTISPKTGRMTNFSRDNGTWQDGGIILSFPDGHWEAVFLAFASQASVTDDRGQPAGPLFSAILPVGRGPAPGQDAGSGGGDNGTGEGDEVPPPPPVQIPADTPAGALSIEAALVNPVGPDEHPTAGSGETVFLLNQSTTSIALAGWTLANGAGQYERLGEDAAVPALSKVGFPVPHTPLSNRGGEIVLKDPQGAVVAKVSYTKEQAKREGKLVYFHDKLVRGDGQ